jgi:DNA polymerase I-like protein with 3'-5' exonuclease and polymerase domains
MTTTVLDIETSITRKSFTSLTSGKKHDYKDNMPYEAGNKLVSVGYKCSDVEDYLLFHHKELTLEQIAQVPANRSKLQAVLDKTTLLVGHNIKYDLQWLYECGFKYNGKVFDTLLFEYVLSKGTYVSLKLGDCCTRRGIPVLVKDMLSEHLDAGGNTDDMPLQDLITYGKADIEITTKLYMIQKNLIATSPVVKRMLPTLKARNEFILTLIDMERNGFKIDPTALADIETEYRARLDAIEPRLKQIIVEAVGHTPINLDSPEQLSELVFGFKIHDKKTWSEYFNLGTEKEGQRKGKNKYKRRRTEEQVLEKIEECSIPLFKTESVHCKDCGGKGYYYKVTKKGVNYKRSTCCPVCDGNGFCYKSTGEPGGLGLRPLPYQWAAQGGFSIGKKSIEWVMENVTDIPPLAKEFMSLLLEYSAISTYLGNFVEGIQRKVSGDNILHMQYNQCVTKTGRLSSSWHNMPRGKTFPIKKVVVSRWEGGKIINADFSGLEFRMAALLAQDFIAIGDIRDKIDTHTQTAKNHTFKPLFGGVTGTDVEKAYYEWFLDKYSGIRDWQNSLAQQALQYKQIISPSGMHYAFPYTSPLPNGSVTGSTQIFNYCIQGFAFEIVMIAIIELNKKFKELGLKSKVCINIHDSAVADAHPDEIDTVLDVMKTILSNANKYIKQYYPAANDNVPLEYEMHMGDDWYNMEEIAI